MLDKLKKIQGINHNEFDDTINMWITAAKLDLKSIGIVDTLIEKENQRLCWDDEKSSISDILWQLYEICLYNNENTDKICEIITIMATSNQYSINQILEFINEKKDANKDDLTPYCPYCGAEMKEIEG